MSPGLHSSISDGYSPGKPLPPGHVRMRHSSGRSPGESKSIALSDPRIDHAATCPNCMNRLLALRQERQSSETEAGLGTCRRCVHHPRRRIRSRGLDMRAESSRCSHKPSPIPETVDLWNAATYRGQQPGQLQAVLLPAARVHLTIILPRFSFAGQYLVGVTRDQNGNGVVAEGAAAIPPPAGLSKRYPLISICAA